jgi:hypothetical protein
MKSHSIALKERNKLLSQCPHILLSVKIKKKKEKKKESKSVASCNRHGDEGKYHTKAQLLRHGVVPTKSLHLVGIQTSQVSSS